jgi:alanyl-tRNA synthetase
MLKVHDIRREFLDFFAQNAHEVVQSSSLVPHNDPTLMFTNSGMVQFKNVFTGIESRSYSRAASSQKSVRAGGKHNDLDNVGYTARHHTFFEMLGNFSFGDYFKEEAISYAWTFLTSILSLPKEKLYVTVYHEDEQAAGYWKKIAGLNDDRIIRIKTSDNFWSMGDTGPCGPCSEIFYDHGEKIWGGLPGTLDENGDRFIEIWNLVFMQFEQLEDGSRLTLPKPSIDTGMGLERIAAVLQGVHNNYEIDLFRNLIEAISDISKISVHDGNIASFRVIADHLRSVAFLIADGVMPSNEGRGYVLRRIMRRALRHIHQIGSTDLVMHKLVSSLANEMGAAYPELNRAELLIKETIYQEETKFQTTLSRGLKLLDDATESLGQNDVLSGAVAFSLYDTYGFPLDLTVDILKSKNLQVDIPAFDLEMQKQKEKARNAWKGSGDKKTEALWYEILDQHGATEFVGYDNHVCEAIILAIIAQDNLNLIITNQTPFYAESGGQVGDRGFISIKSKLQVEVIETRKYLGKIHAHVVKSNNMKVGDVVQLAINEKYRQEIKRNHSATHILHHVLRDLLGNHIVQKGSLVTNEYLRFDFSHPKSLSVDDLRAIESTVNQCIMENNPVNIKSMSIDDAMASGAMALFGEKYDAEVRVIKMGQSIELCGGTHVTRTGDIGAFRILSESSIASGVRRIEAITGSYALDYAQSHKITIDSAADMLKAHEKELLNKIEALMLEKKHHEKEIKDLKRQLLQGDVVAHDELSEVISDDVTLLVKIRDNLAPQDIREYVDSKRSKPGHAVFAASKFEGKATLVIGLSKDLAAKSNAADLVKEACIIAGGQGGGGRNDVAQAGGYDFSKIDLALSLIKEKLRNV